MISLHSLQNIKFAQKMCHIDTQVGTDFFHFPQRIFVDGDAFCKNPLRGFHFFFAVGIDAGLAFGLGALAQFFQEGGKMGLDGFRVPKEVGIDGNETMASAAGCADMGMITG